MKKITIAFVLLFTYLSSPVSAQKKSKKDQLITLQTDQGTMHLILFDETPKHKANFIKLVEEKFYDGLLFHRVIEDFMIQGGDPNSKNADSNTFLGSGENGYRIPAEFNPKRFHQKGALAAARDNNPAKESSGCQFYIVEGKKWKKEELEKQFQRTGVKLTEEQINIYQTIGGAPHLDGGYSVFGQVIDGLATVDRISMVKTNPMNRPLENVKMSMTVKKIKKKKIERKFGYKYN
jgi:cyclophilin family peptidyl-prolyl cis-trans isomerase